jgi:hypothetical protein
MKRPALIFSLILIVTLLCVMLPVAAAPIIVNHTSTHLAEIPLSAIKTAKSNLHIAYGHTSHGSQIITGMTGLLTFPGAPHGNTTYTFNNGGTGGALDLKDNPFSGAYDLGNPDRTRWASATRNYLNANPRINVIIWAWCGEAETATASDINTYLTLMNGLESEFPNVKFVYMTGHLTGTGADGNLNLRNEQIRNYVRTHNKILYDFADIESFNPDGITNYMQLYANDNCDYSGGNWATQWQNTHTIKVDWYTCSPAHTKPLNGNLKAYAAWWLWARLGGWDGGSAVTSSGSQIGVFRPSNHIFYLENGSVSTMVNYGAKTDIPVSGDWNEDGLWDIGVFRNSTHTFILKNGTRSTKVNWGLSTDLTVTGDWNGDGLYDVGVFRPSMHRFYLKNGTRNTTLNWGLRADLPVSGDWNGDGLYDVGVFRPSMHRFYLKNGTRNTTVNWGLSTDLPVSGDWNGDGLYDVGVFRNSIHTFVLKNGTRNTTINYGLRGDKPVSGKWS